MRGYIVSRSKSYPSVVHPTDSLMNVNRGPPCDSRASFTRRRRRYGRDLQLLSTSEIFDKFCLQRLQWSKKWAVPASCISWRSRGNRGPQTPDKKRCSYKAINCLRCGVSLRMEQRGASPYSETTVKSLIDDLYVNGWKSWLPAWTFVIYSEIWSRAASMSRANARNNYHGGHEADYIYVLEIAINEITMVNMDIFICYLFIYLFCTVTTRNYNNKEVILLFWL